MTKTSTRFDSFVLKRTTRETIFTVGFGPRCEPGGFVELPNRILAHLLDHMLKASGVALELPSLSWPGSWQFDHVLCEDFGQIVGAGIAEIHDQLQSTPGVAGRGSATVCMDDSLATCTMSIEGRPRCDWLAPPGQSIDGFVDAWYDSDGRMSGHAMGTNLRQFFDGFAVGSGSAIRIDIQSVGNLHHTFEVVFRAFGDAIGQSLGTASAKLAGDTSGLAGIAEYVLER